MERVGVSTKFMGTGDLIMKTLGNMNKPKDTKTDFMSQFQNSFNDNNINNNDSLANNNYGYDQYADKNSERDDYSEQYNRKDSDSDKREELAKRDEKHDDAIDDRETKHHDDDSKVKKDDEKHEDAKSDDDDNVKDEATDKKDTDKENKESDKAQDDDSGDDSDELAEKDAKEESDKAKLQIEKMAMNKEAANSEAQEIDESQEVKNEVKKDAKPKAQVKKEVKVNTKGQTELKTPKHNSKQSKKAETLETEQEINLNVVDTAETQIDMTKKEVAQELDSNVEVATNLSTNSNAQKNSNKQNKVAPKKVYNEPLKDRLESETGVKINKMTLEQTKSNNDSNNSGGNNLLKSLEQKHSNAFFKKMKLAKENRTGSADTELNFKDLKLNTKTDVLTNLTKNIDPKLGKGQNLKPNLGGNNNDSANMGNTKTDSDVKSFKNANVSQTNQPQQTNIAKNITTIQEIMNNVKTMLRGADINPNSKLVLDFETKVLGQMKMGVLHKDGGIQVSIEVGSDSSKHELMKQKDELANQLKGLGYKFVDVDISYNDHHQQQHEQQDEEVGNQDIRNVKLAGNDKNDLEEILAMR
jgi:hypothetical protein